MLRIVIALILFAPAGTFACQVSCRVFELSSNRGRLLQRDGQPIPFANLIVRDASIEGTGPDAFCGARKGAVVATLKTDKKGAFNLKHLKSGSYWITYQHPEDGESFFVTMTVRTKSKAFELSVDSFGGLCYLVDIERNMTKPPGWPAPLKPAAKVMKEQPE